MISVLFRAAVFIIIVNLLLPEVKGNNKCGPLFLTVTANTKTKVIMNWQFTCTDSPDTLILCSTSFENECKEILTKLTPIKSKKGTYETEVSFGYDSKFPGGWEENDENPINGSHCFPYWIISLKNDKKIDQNCLKIEPTWMSKFGKLRIGSMMIPGTHNSGAWRGIPFLVKNFVLNQDRNLWRQLVSGIRFFDLRIGYINEGFWINHDFVFVTPLEPEMQHVLAFLQKTRTEIVILNFHRFPSKNFSAQNHRDLVNFLQNLFADFILPPTDSKEEKGPTLKEIWKTGKRLILSYNNQDMINEHNWLWQPVNRDWGEKSSIQDMHKYIKSVINDEGNPMVVIMAEPTPTVWTFFKYKSLRGLADAFNPQLNDWMRNEKWDDEVNIAAVDFFMSTDIVNIAIEGNEERLANYSKLEKNVGKLNR